MINETETKCAVCGEEIRGYELRRPGTVKICAACRMEARRDAEERDDRDEDKE